jgi:uncharacterized protein YdeI (YjbR/CyaY-like superfamily)
MGKLDDLGHVTARDRAAWREWLAENHATSPGVWLVYYKKGSGKASVGYDEAVEEALCFGWIDSKVNSLDDERYKQVYAPRKKGSVWSRLNKERVARLLRQDRITEAGMAKISAAKADGSWSLLDPVEDLIVPEDLQTALDAQPSARETFASFSPSQKKPALWLVYRAKRAATREKRIAEVVEAAALGLTVAEYRSRRPEP